MSPKAGKFSKLKRINKFSFRQRRVVFVNISPKKNVSQVKPSSNFRELAVGMVIPSVLGPYEIISELAIGKCCEVYLGENVSTKMQDAIKVFIRDQHYKGALLRELKFLAKLSPHPHIVTPKTAFHYEGRDILIHELLSGTLKDILALHKGQNPSLWFVMTLALHLMRGLAHMHKHGVVHGDLKPHNIMWSAQEETFKLIDFGVSFSATEDMEHAVQSRAYQAPEVVRWNQWLQLKMASSLVLPPTPPKPGSPIDVWSVGCLVAEVLIGAKVFTFGWDGEDVPQSLKAVLCKVQGGSQGFLSSAFAWLKRCLDVDPQKRWRAEEAERGSFLDTSGETPSFFDLLMLPTPVIRVMNLMRPDMDQTLVLDLVKSVVAKATVGRGPTKQVLDPGTRSLFLRYERTQDAEGASQALRHTDVGGFTIIHSFFPLKAFEEGRFF